MSLENMSFSMLEQILVAWANASDETRQAALEYLRAAVRDREGKSPRDNGV